MRVRVGWEWLNLGGYWRWRLKKGHQLLREKKSASCRQNPGYAYVFCYAHFQTYTLQYTHTKEMLWLCWLTVAFPGEGKGPASLTRRAARITHPIENQPTFYINTCMDRNINLGWAHITHQHSNWRIWTFAHHGSNGDFCRFKGVDLCCPDTLCCKLKSFLYWFST